MIPTATLELSIFKFQPTRFVFDSFFNVLYENEENVERDFKVCFGNQWVLHMSCNFMFVYKIQLSDVIIAHHFVAQNKNNFKYNVSG